MRYRLSKTHAPGFPLAPLAVLAELVECDFFNSKVALRAGGLDEDAKPKSLSKTARVGSQTRSQKPPTELDGSRTAA